MNTVYVVFWTSASQDNNAASHAYGGVHGVYASLDKALMAFEECKEQCYKEIVDPTDPEFDEDFEHVRANILAETYIGIEEFEII